MNQMRPQPRTLPARSTASAARGAGPIRILLVDDHAVIRQALRMLLEAQPELEVVADVENGREAVQAVERLQPDVVLMDVVMPGLNGLEATRQIRRIAPSTRVVMLSGFVDEDQLLDAIRSGASGYIVKKSDVSELVLAIQTVHRGNSYFSSSLSEGFDLAEVLYQAKRADQRNGMDTLTSREREVLQLIAEGYTNQGIANELYISVKTVEAHKAHIMAKLHARNRTDLIRYAIRKGIVRLESVDEAQAMLDDAEAAAG
ncbi:LuxR family two component transcriptional regulator [Tepidiforma thermophila]|uniref:LuxR family two component transcriptional regulator n=2 Tax=Tepidiforma thermophila (strain KCTC 52669 / CGMCC 1.13589 / G233) TaxID=2761530 RepID=A0A2A9HCW0_TEPT2|nr:LuxR family two component transcriptional regulator [Tepidiforma thermophila]